MEAQHPMHLGFDAEHLSETTLASLTTLGRQARADILTMTSLAASGHPGGSMSSVDTYLLLYACARVFPGRPQALERDRIVVSHGHTSPGVYSTLAAFGFIDKTDAIAGFRQAWSPFEGHIEREVPGVEWSTGNLGQGLSAGCGMALASRIHQVPFRVWVCMGDGEQQKGQIAEARRFAVKYGLTNLGVVVDLNLLQISGDIRKVMPQNIRAGWEADGWEVVEVDGHDLQALYGALRRAARATERPVCILAHTVMGKGVPMIEHQEKYHGTPLSPSQYAQAMQVLDMPDLLEHYRAARGGVRAKVTHHPLPAFTPDIDPGTPRTYTVETKTDNRSAWGAAVTDLGKLNAQRSSATPVVVFDCDLAESVKTGPFAHALPERFIQSGIMEHHTAVAAGALSTQGVLTFWADFGVFGVDEAYNQQRLNDINHTHLKTVCTHSGLDVGEDGKTHQSIDYIGLLRNVFGYRCYLPADPNETDRIIRHVAVQGGNDFIGMGRSKIGVILGENGQPYFAGSWTFTPGKAEMLRSGDAAVLWATGTMTHRAVVAADALRQEGIHVRVLHSAMPLEIDPQALADAVTTGLIVSLEDHHWRTGLGASLMEALVEAQKTVKLVRLGARHYQPSGTADDVFAAAGLDTASIVKAVKAGLAGG